MQIAKNAKGEKIMARITMEEVTTNSFEEQERMSFFTLKNDKDFAYVRFMHPNTDSLIPYTVHKVEAVTNTGKKFYPTIDCLRSIGESVSACPFCSSGDEKLAKLSQDVIIKMIQYKTDLQGNVIEATPVIWQKSASWVKYNFQTYVDTYGANLPNIIFKITRVGAKGDTNTKYTFTPMIGVPNFDDSKYPIPTPNKFDTWDEYGTIISVKSKDDMTYFAHTGTFPMKYPSNNASNSTPLTPNSISIPDGIDEEMPFEEVPAPANIPQSAITPNSQTTPWNTPNTGMTTGAVNRPVRRYQ